MDAGTNRFVPIENDSQRDRVIEKFKEFVTDNKPLEDGPPIFEEGEILTIKGYHFRIGRIDPNKMILRPVREASAPPNGESQ